MAISITILSVRQIPADPYSGTPAKQAADFAITNDNLAFYSYSAGNVPQGQDVQTFLNAEALALFTAAQANGVTITANQVLTGAYAYQHWANRDVFGQAWLTLDNGFLVSAPTLANYRTVLQSTRVVLVTLPAAFVTEFTNEVTAFGLPANNVDASTFTLAQCQAYHQFLARWILDRMMGALWAKIVVGVLS